MNRPFQIKQSVCHASDRELLPINKFVIQTNTARRAKHVIIS